MVSSFNVELSIHPLWKGQENLNSTWFHPLNIKSTWHGNTNSLLESKEVSKLLYDSFVFPRAKIRVGWEKEQEYSI